MIPLSPRSVAKQAIHRLSQWDLLTAAYRRPRLLVLCYHGVISQSRENGDAFGYINSVFEAEFKRQLEYLGQRFRFLDLAGLGQWWNGQRWSRPPVLITFDDGYRNNLTRAAPILRQVGAPAVFFLTTAYLGTDRILWTDDLVLRIVSSPGAHLPAVDVPGGGSIAASVVPGDLQERRRLATAWRNALKKLSDARRRELLESVAAATTLDPGLVDHELTDFLTWDEARRLRSLGFEIGSHTVNHPILSRTTPDTLADELGSSAARLETELGSPVEAIAFPNGGSADYNDAVVAATRRQGYRFAFTMADRFQTPGGDPLTISRVGVPGHSSEGAFAFAASGLRDWMRGRSRA
jgi:peptidoglycan/xylan/chitin deacetylase (PgdA/CDA1 family)